MATLFIPKARGVLDMITLRTGSISCRENLPPVAPGRFGECKINPGGQETGANGLRAARNPSRNWAPSIRIMTRPSHPERRFSFFLFCVSMIARAPDGRWFCFHSRWLPQLTVDTYYLPFDSLPVEAATRLLHHHDEADDGLLSESPGLIAARDSAISLDSVIVLPGHTIAARRVLTIYWIFRAARPCGRSITDPAPAPPDTFHLDDFEQGCEVTLWTTVNGCAR